MNVYDSLKDLYEGDSIENEITLSKCECIIDGKKYNGFSVSIKGELYFIYHLLNAYGEKRNMGNKWTVYNITKSKTTLSGVKTKKEAIYFLKNV